MRIIQSLALCTMAVLAFLLNGWLGDVPTAELPALAGVFGLVALVQWMLMLGLFWPLLMMRGIRLHCLQDLPGDSPAKQKQFAIRELLIVTFAVAVFLGATRWWILSQQAADQSTNRTVYFYGYLVLSNLLLTIPLLVATVLRRYGVVLTLIACAFAGLVTVSEIAVFLHYNPMPWPESQKFHRMFWTVNGVQALWVLLAMGALRLGGYRLAVRPATASSPSANA